MGTSGSLKVYVLTRLLLAVPMLLILLTFVFVLLHLAPGDPVLAVAPPGAPDATLDRIRRQLGLDKPLWRQYVDYLVQLAQFDLGFMSTNRGVPVEQRIQERFPATLELTLSAMLVAVTVGITLGAAAGAKRGGPLDLFGRLFGILIYSMPIFWLGLMAILMFSVLPHEWGPPWSEWAPPSGGRGPTPRWQWGADEGAAAEVTRLRTVDALIALDFQAFRRVVKHLILPAGTLGLVIAGVFVRITRVNLIQSMQADYIEAARARGVRERGVVLRHGLKNALIPIITVVGLTFALLLGGAVLTENVFNWPGLASELTRAIGLRDYNLVQGITVFFAVIVVTVSIAIDILNAYVDPRIRY